MRSRRFRREIKEELDVNIVLGDLIETVEYDYPAFHLSMDCFWCELSGGAPKLLEAEDGRWLTKAELYTVPWLPADISLIRNIESKMGEPDLLRMQALRLLRHLCEEHILPETVFHAPVPETQNFSALVSRLRLALGERYPSTKLKRIMKSVHYANGFSDTDLREAALRWMRRNSTWFGTASSTMTAALPILTRESRRLILPFRRSPYSAS